MSDANSMGLFLQNTNIIRDYLEDMEDGRTWWPQDIWEHHAQKLEWFSKHPDSPKSVDCLNEMVCNAVQLLPACLDYMAKISDRSTFQFCAVPQVMAIATLANLYNNKNVFKGVVKIRKGLSAKLMLKTKTYRDFKAVVYDFSSDILRKMDREAVKTSGKEPSYVRSSRKVLEQVLADTRSAREENALSVSDKSFPHSAARIFFFLLLSVVFFIMFTSFPLVDSSVQATQ